MLNAITFAIKSNLEYTVSELKGTSENRSPGPVSQMSIPGTKGEMTHPTAHWDGADPRTQVFSPPVLSSNFFFYSSHST